MRRVVAITALNYFISGALTLVIPLLLLDRSVSVADIGVVLSIMPLIFLTARIVFATFADHIGWAHIFVVLNWPATLAATMIYFFAQSIPAFSAGKIVEGLKDSAYWAVNRTAIFSLAPEKKEKEATRINAVIWLSTALGSAAAGIGIAYLGFSATLGILILASVIMGVPAGLLLKQERESLRPKPKLKPDPATRSLSPKGKGKMFWLVSINLAINSFSVYPLVTLLLPVFMAQQLGYGYLSIGLAFLLYNVASALVTLFALRKPLGKTRAIIQSAIGLFAGFWLANSGFFFFALFLALAVMRGLGIGFFEASIIKVTKNSLKVSVDIGFLHIPTRLVEFFSVLTAGFLSQSIGYAPLFAASGVSFAIFSALSLYILRQK